MRHNSIYGVIHARRWSVAMVGRERIVWLDYAKGVGILLVVLGHIVRGLVDNGLVSPNNSGFHWFDFTLYTFHMPLFFLLSGMTAKASLDRGKSNFVRGKLWTIAYPYVLWSILFGILRVLFSSKGVTWDRLAWIAIYPMSIFWFLYVLFMCHMAFAFCPPRQRNVLFGVSIAAFSISEFVPPGIKEIWPPLFYFFGAMPFYMAGHFLRTAASSIKIKTWTVPVLTAGFIASVLFAHFMVNWQYQSVAAIPASIFGIAVIISIARQVGTRVGVVLATLGAASMTIYVSHTLIASIARKILERMHINDVPTNIALLFVACIAVSVLGHFTLKRLRILHLFGLAAPKSLKPGATPVPAQ